MPRRDGAKKFFTRTKRIRQRIGRLKQSRIDKEKRAPQ